MRAVASALALLALAATAACRRDIELFPSKIHDPGAGGAPGSGGPGGATGIDNAIVGDPITLPTKGGPVCASTLAQRGNGFALCACEAMNFPSAVRIDAIGATDDMPLAGLATNGDLQTAAALTVTGALYVSAATGVHASESLLARGTVRVAGPFAQLQGRAVLGETYTIGAITGDVTIGGSLYIPNGVPVDPTVTFLSRVPSDPMVPPQCDCSAGFVDIASTVAVAAAAVQNGTAPMMLAWDLLANGATAPARLDLQPGTFFLTSIDTSSPLTFAVHGRTLLAVQNDVGIRAGLAVELDPGAELDLVIGGRLVTSGGGTLGTIAAPSRFRIWIGSAGSVALDQAPVIGATVRAPFAAVSAASGLELYGALLARSVAFGAEARIHFDPELFSAGAPCGEPISTPPP